MLQVAMELDAQALPDPIERRIDRQIRILPAAGAEVSGRVERVALIVEHQNAVLQQAGKVISELQPNLAVFENRMLEQQPAFPATVRLQIGIAAVDAAKRQLGRADEIVEVELGDR